MEVTYYCNEDMIHGFLGFAGIMDQGKDLIELLAIIMFFGGWVLMASEHEKLEKSKAKIEESEQQV